MPASIQTRFQGAAEAFRASLDSTLLLILAAIVTMYIVLGVLYESYIHPITILSTLPSAGVGALLALLLTGTDLSLIAVIGIILLIGIVKKNAIMMIDFALDAERTRGDGAEDAIYQAALLRFRPILMTTLAALFGALPLMLATGSGAELRQPLGLVMVGGLLVSQVLTLFTTPVIYLFFDRLARAGGRRAAGRPFVATRHGESDGMSLSSPFIRRPVATTLLNLSIILAGAVAFALLPVSPLPQVDFPVILVSAHLPGRQPRDDGLERRRRSSARSAPSPASTRSPRPARRDRRASTSSSTSARTSTPPRARCRRRSTPRGRCCRARLPGMPSYRKINPSQAPIMILALTSQHEDDERDLRPRLDRARAEGGAGHRRRRRHRRRRLAAGGARRAAAERARPLRHLARRGAPAIGERQPAAAQGRCRRRRARTGRCRRATSSRAPPITSR